MKNFNRNIVLFAAVFGFASSLDCHQCASKDGGCLDPYDSSDLDNSDGCDDLDTHCFKHKTVLRLYDSGAILGKARETVTETRGCTRRDGKSDGCLFKEVDAGFMFYCLCSEDNCNAGEMTAASSLMLMISLVASIVLVKCA